MESKKIKVGVVGGAGYTGGETLRLLVNHPNVEITFVQSRSQAGKKISDTHRDLLGDCDLVFA
ncbi:MAG TPA: N-acetyl-gamma-glutamyl-phosphate reductase, partial [Cytophagales bacterium]|nr:N-acetyl-gamma-glutamyl-phosphate reductase [Cytophagales bacterium]